MSLVRRADPSAAHAEVRIAPMRRRHLRSVLAIEAQVYPRPWSAGVFRSELSAARDGSRLYLVAHVGRTLVGYAGLLMQLDDGHVTNIAVDPAWQRHHVGTRLLLALARGALARGAHNLTLEVRVSNTGAQAMYRRFGFVPAGVRPRYYENVEDAIVMWAMDADQPAYLDRLAQIEAALQEGER